jgi:ABC-type multidrug transport system fused ATPase/permease subunit
MLVTFFRPFSSLIDVCLRKRGTLSWFGTRIRERKASVTVLLCGTSGCGKSTLASLLVIFCILDLYN